MRAKKKKGGGGSFETSRSTDRRIARETRKNERKEARTKKRRQDVIDQGTPGNPRFLIGAPTRKNGGVPSKPTPEEPRRRRRVVNRRGKGGTNRGGTQQGRGRRTPASCRS